MSGWTNGKKIYKAIELAANALKEADALADLVYISLEEKVNASKDIHFIGDVYFDSDLRTTVTGDVTTDWANSFFLKSATRKKNTELTIQIQYSLCGEYMTSDELLNEEPLIFIGICTGHDPISFDSDNSYSLENVLLPTTKILNSVFLTNSDNEVDGDFSWCCYVLRLTSVNNQQDVLNKIVDPVLKMAELRLMDGRLTVETLDELALKIGSGMAKFTTTNGKYSISFQD